MGASGKSVSAAGSSAARMRFHRSDAMISEASLHEKEIVEQGYTIIEGIFTDAEAEAALSNFGTLINQYNGELRYEVSAEEDHEKRALSKSIKGVPWHVDAPSWDPSPRRMALHCRAQALCGSGHTDLADMRHFIATLSDEDRAPLYEQPVPWIDRNTRTGIDRPIVEVLADGREIIRWRQSLLVGTSNARLLSSEANRQPLGEFGLHLAELSEKFYAEYAKAILTPENAILLWDNQRLIHQRRAYSDPRRRMTRYWMAD
jgi:alpha-ketoglutarate-dependent taurine dioxygenase